MTRHLIPLLSLLLLAGCMSKPVVEDQTRLASACQVTKCRCVGETASMFHNPSTADVRWKRGGDAYCEEGFHLERYDPDAKPKTY
jgi:hypothetical protein